MTAVATVAVLWPRVSGAVDRIVLGSSIYPPLVGTDGAPGYMDLIVREAFGRLGIEARIETLPGDRSMRMSNEGLTDGEALRASGFESEYPNLLLVPGSLLEIEFMAWSTRRDIRIAGWQDLRPLAVAYPLGWKIYDREVTQAREIIRVRSMEQLFPLLAASRVDVVLLDRWQGMYLTRLAGIPAHPIEPPLAKRNTFMYLHVKHRALVDRIAAAIAAMHADGSIKRIYDQALKGYTPK